MKLRAVCSTPIGGGLQSPSVLLQSRNLRGSPPFVKESLKHQDISRVVVDAALNRWQASAAFHQTTVRSSRLSVLVLNQCVRVRVGKKWVLGNVKVVCQKSDSCGDHSGCQRVSQKPEDNKLLPQCSGQRGSSSAYDWLPFEG